MVAVSCDGTSLITEKIKQLKKRYLRLKFLYNELSEMKKTVRTEYEKSLTRLKKNEKIRIILDHLLKRYSRHEIMIRLYSAIFCINTENMKAIDGALKSIDNKNDRNSLSREILKNTVEESIKAKEKYQHRSKILEITGVPVEMIPHAVNTVLSDTTQSIQYDFKDILDLYLIQKKSLSEIIHPKNDQITGAYSRWTIEEEERLKQGTIILNRWFRVSHSSFEEKLCDQVLSARTNAFKFRKYKFLSEIVESKTPKQCRDKLTNRKDQF